MKASMFATWACFHLVFTSNADESIFANAVLKVLGVSYTEMRHFWPKFVQPRSVLGSLTALAAIVADETTLFVLVWLFSILEFADRAVKAWRAFTSKVGSLLVADTIVNTKELTVLGCSLVAIVVRLILAVFSSVGDFLRMRFRAITVMLVSCAVADCYTFASVKAVVLAAFGALDLALKAMKEVGTLTVLVVGMFLPELEQVVVAPGNILLYTESAISSILTR
jgi:hypothetical protein